MNFPHTMVIGMAPRPQDPNAPQPSPFVSLLPLILIFVIFYFLLIRPQAKRAKEHRAMVEALKAGDEVLTSGGLYGRVTRVGDDRVTLEIAEKTRVQVSRESVAKVLSEKSGRQEEKSEQSS